MEKKDLQKLLSQPYKQDNWKQIVQFVFPNVSILSSPKEFPINNEKIKKFRQIGSVRLNDGKNLALFELLLADTVNIQRNRVELNNEISKYIDQEQIHGVLSVFEQGTDDYRFTFSARSTEFDEEESDFVQKKTDTKRYTYVLGKNESCKTPADRFYKLSENKSEVDINAIQNAFSVEQLSKEFFDKYKKQFEKFWKYIASKEEYKGVFINGQGEREVKIRNFTKKLLGRIVFLHFLQKKGWMGCPEQELWGAGDKKFMQNLFKDFTNKEQFHSKCLVELFYNTLNAKRDDQLFSCEGLEGALNNSKVPYLNGGLFDSDKLESKKIDFPESYFEDLFDFFGQYNFTIDENDPNDHEVGIDPEMLGHIFENLLEDNKDKGTFYTPKVIVQYMCQESLIEYLATKLEAETSDEVKQAIEDLIRNQLAEDISDLDLVEPIAQALFDVKICDPAIGSGAFPMGILNVIYQVINALYYLQPDSVARVWNISDQDWQPHLVKKNIIQHSIYGVDIESGAVDIARLRFWLALVVDEVEPLPLPNLDYKIMQGNSLLESFEGIDLSQISDAAAYEAVYESEQIELFSGEAKKKVSMSPNYADIKALMDEYFNANEPDTKKDLHQRIDDQVRHHIHITISKHKKELRKKAEKLEKKVGFDEAAARTWEQKEKIRTKSKAAKELVKLNKEFAVYDDKENKLAQLSKSNERPFFLWKLFFQEVFEKGGFDIVIGNPPYLSSKGVSDTIKDYYGIKDDLYNYFFIVGDNILSENGIFCYITSNTFLTLQSKSNIRNLLLNRQIINISNLGYDVFETAMVSTAVTIYRKKKTEKDNLINYLDARGKGKFSNAEMFNIFQTEFETSPNNVFFTPNEFNLSIHKRYSIVLKDLINNHWDKISTSRNIHKYELELNTYRSSLSPGDVTLLGLVSDGGQGMATANNGKFIGLIKGTAIANRTVITRHEKLENLNKKYNTSYSIEGLDEKEIRALFDNLKIKFGRDCFGQGYLYRIVDNDEINLVENLSESEKKFGLSGSKTFVPYDKGDKDGNRWYLETPYLIDWNENNVKFLYSNSGKKGRGMPVIRNPQFYFKEGFCWSDIHTVLIKSRLKGKSVYDVKSMSLFPVIENITSKYIVCILNSYFASEFSFEFLNNTSTLQINDARCMPIIVPTPKQLLDFEAIFDKAYEVQKKKFSKSLSQDLVDKKLHKIQEELNKKTMELYSL
jgi:BMFP domain-containing protein YqiC